MFFFCEKTKLLQDSTAVDGMDDNVDAHGHTKHKQDGYSELRSSPCDHESQPETKTFKIRVQEYIAKYHQEML